MERTILMADDERCWRVVVAQNEAELAGIGRDLKDDIGRVRLTGHELPVPALRRSLICPSAGVDERDKARVR